MNTSCSVHSCQTVNQCHWQWETPRREKKKISFWREKKLTITFAMPTWCDWEFASGNDDSCWPDGSKSPTWWIYFPLIDHTSFGIVALSIVWTGILAKCSRVSIPTFFVVVDFFLHLRMWSSCKVVALFRNKMTLKRTLWAARRPEMKFDRDEIWPCNLEVLRCPHAIHVPYRRFCIIPIVSIRKMTNYLSYLKLP